MKIIKWIVYITHILAGIALILLYTFALREDFFIEITLNVIILFFGSAIVAVLFRKTQKKGIKTYFFILSALAATYIMGWVVIYALTYIGSLLDH